MTEKGLKAIGLAATAVGAVVTIVSGIVSDKKMENTIAKEVAKQLEKNK